MKEERKKNSVNEKVHKECKDVLENHKHIIPEFFFIPQITYNLMACVAFLLSIISLSIALKLK